MERRFTLFIFMTSILTLATFYSPSSNFVSATSECFGEGSLDHVFCFAMLGEPPQIHVFECVRDADGKWDCHGITKKATPPGIDQVIENTIQEVGPSNPNDSKDLGGMKSDKGLTKSPIQ